MKFKRVRALLKNTGYLIKGYSRRFSKAKVEEEVHKGMNEMVRYTMPVVNRPELGEKNRNRIHNMRLCCDLIDNIHLKPGTVFSLEKIIGEPSPARGFKVGPVIVDGTRTDGYGGGICQISTLLFNVALQGNLKILEKHNHSSDIWGEKRMVDLGRDAAYVYLLKDLKFTNDSLSEMVLKLKLDEDKREITGIMKTHSPSIENDVMIETAVLEENTIKRNGNGSVTAAKGWVIRTRRVLRHTGNVTYEKIETYR